MDRLQAIATLTATGQDYEITNTVIHGADCRIFGKGPGTLREMFASTRSDQAFIIYENEAYTYEEAWQAACAMAAVLVEQYGIGKGDRVAISMRNCPEWMIAFCAITSIGAVAVAMNSLWQTEEMHYALEDSGARLLFADKERIAQVLSFVSPLDLQVIAVRADAQGAIASWSALLSGGAATDMPAQTPLPTDDATIFYTSGSTGHPKGVVSCHLNIISALLSWELEAQIGGLLQASANVSARVSGQTVATKSPVNRIASLLAVPLFHATGSHAIFLSAFRRQFTLVCMSKWDVARAAELVVRERVAIFIAPATMTGDLVNHCRTNQLVLDSLLVVGGGGSPRAPEQVRSIDNMSANTSPSTGWGMTETNAIGSAISGSDYVLHPGSSGRCSAVLDIRVVDGADRPLPIGERGELQIRGASLFKGYWNRPDTNAECFVDGWFRTGDVAYLNEEGYVFIVDRLKDLVIRGGENIGCGEVEAALLEHPDVLEASVYAVPDERMGEEVGATVYCSTDIEPAALREFLVAHIAKFKIPRYLQITREQLPRIATGKINKKLLREEARSHYAS